MGHPRKVPDFVIIGAMKSATTTLYGYLCRHPDVFMCSPKEPQYFSREHVFKRGADWYRQLFASAEAHRICGEASTCYSRYPQYPNVPARLKGYNADVKLIYLMRHPVERAYSHYKHRIRTRCHAGNTSVPDFEQAIRGESEILDASRYMMQIEQYLAHFTREQMLFLTFDELTSDPRNVMQRLQRFLGLDVLELTADGPIKANEGNTAFSRQAWRRLVRRWRSQTRLDPLIRAIPERQRRAVGRWLRQNPLGEVVGEQLTTRLRSQIAPLTAEARRMLLEHFEPSISRLEVFLGRDLASWRQ